MSSSSTLADVKAYVEENQAAAIAVAAAVVILVPLLIKLLSAPSKPKLPVWLDASGDYKPLPLTAKEWITHNTVRLRFTLPHPEQRLGLPIGQHISFLAKDSDGKDVYRSYTPVSDDDLVGAVEFVIKIYPSGKMSQAINKLEVGQTLMMRGPKGRFTYTPNMKKHIGMLAGGTGITPMYQVLCAILKNPADKTKVSLVCGNLTAEDILLKDELAALEQQHPGQLKVYHVLNTPPAGWQQGSGFITPDIIKAQLPGPGPDALVLHCGPGPMTEAMKKHTAGLGFTEEQQFFF